MVYAAGSCEGCCQSGQDTDDQLDDELPLVLLGAVTRNGDGFQLWIGTQKPDMYILSTISELNLMKRFDDKAKQWLKKEMNRLERRAGQDWDSIKAEMKPLALPAADDPDIVYSAVIGAIIDSDIMEKWFKSL